MVEMCDVVYWISRNLNIKLLRELRTIIDQRIKELERIG